MKHLLFALLFISPPWLKPWLLRTIGGARIGKHVKIGWFASISAKNIQIGDYSEIRALTLINCDKAIQIGRYSIVSSFNLIYGAADFILGDHVYVGPQSLINVEETVKIGNHSALGARTMIFTHGSFFPYTKGYWVKFGPVTIGDQVWCAAGVFIHPGVSIGDHVFVNSRSVLKDDVPSNAVMEGFPAQQIGELSRLQRRISGKRLDQISQQMLQHFAQIILVEKWDLPIPTMHEQTLHFSYHQREYRIGSHSIYRTLNPEANVTTIALLGEQNQQTPLISGLWIDLIQHTRPSTQDPVFEALCEFLQRYYGIQLEFIE